MTMENSSRGASNIDGTGDIRSAHRRPAREGIAKNLVPKAGFSPSRRFSVSSGPLALVLSCGSFTPGPELCESTVSKSSSLYLGISPGSIKQNPTQKFWRKNLSGYSWNVNAPNPPMPGSLFRSNRGLMMLLTDGVLCTGGDNSRVC